MYHWLKLLENKHEDEDEEEEIMKEMVKKDEAEDEDEEEDEAEDEEVKPSTSKKKPKIINIDKNIDDEYKTFLHVKKLPLPSEIMEGNMNLDDLIKKNRR